MSLTPRQLETLDFIVEFIDGNRYAPTLQEIANEFDISRVTVLQHLRALEKKDYLKREPNVSRGIKVLKTPVNEPDRPSPSSSLSESTAGKSANAAENMTKDRESHYPLLGYIAAGDPIEAIENPEKISPGTVLGEKGDCYMLRVKGNSMTGDNIQEDDYVLVREETNPEEGQMVVALLENGEATLKRYYRNNGTIVLKPSNPEHDPIEVEEGDVEIQGVVLGLLRNYSA